MMTDPGDIADVASADDGVVSDEEAASVPEDDETTPAAPAVGSDSDDSEATGLGG
jgi:hypothetical protein